MSDQREARQMLDLAARLAWRGWGYVEPNPLVGCVLVRPGDGPVCERVIGMGHHRRFGEIHAEVDALNNAKAKGHDPAGATAYVTLEPCASQGKQPACTGALIAARIGRVVCARRDPHPTKGRGRERLKDAGIAVEFSEASQNAIRLSDAFVKRVETGLPWVVVKWAQTIDGKIATRTGDSKWISNERSRRWVHLTRGRVDVILSGIGTVKADDPLLSARDVPVRRRAIKAIIDPGMELPPGARLLEAGARIVVFTSEANAGAPACHGEGQVTEIAQRGKTIVGLSATNGRLDLRQALSRLAASGAATVLSECGPGLTSELWGQRLVDEMHVYVAPKLVGDGEAKAAIRGFVFTDVDSLPRMELALSKRIGDDVLLVYRRPWADGTP